MKLEDIIATQIAASTLERVVTDQNVIGKTQRDELFKSGLPPLDLAKKIVEGYGSRTSKLAFGLHEQISDTDWDTANMLVEYFSKLQTEYHNHQASLVGRIPTLPLSELNEFLTLVKGQVCLIVSRRGPGPVSRGTGFLVDSDLVLTCRHVLGQFPDDADITSDGNRIEVYFDFHRGEPVDDLSPDLPEARKVRLAKDWRVDSRPATDPDGVPGDLSPDDAKRIGGALDYILLRLEEQVGLQPLERGGGRQRRWVDLSATALPQNVEGEDWIIIPQHPNGSPQRIDLGRFRKSDPTNTRLRYDTHTAKGSSGAPCFNHKFRLVGLHNAFVGPESNPEYNQAIRATCIAPLVQPHLKPATDDKTYVLRWSLARDHEAPQIVLGREKLLEWLHASASSNPKTLSDRVYVAHTNVSGAGCSFSVDILLAEIRDTKTPRAVYGQCGQQLPATPEDFLHSLLRDLGITLANGEVIPPRPKLVTEDRSATGLAEVDKLQYWISQDLPDWLGGIIDRHVEKVIDARPAAKDAVARLEKDGIDVPQILRNTANSTVPVNVRPNSWDYAYIVLDDLRSLDYSGNGPRVELKGEVRDLIAALVRGKGESVPHAGLRRLRWMFLGYLPDFVPSSGPDGGATVEALAPSQIGVNEVLAIFKRIAQAHIPIDAENVWPEVVAGYAVEIAEGAGPALKLPSLQRETGKVVAKFLKMTGV